jgi:hypothetical protein
LPSKKLPLLFVAILAFRLCLPKRCLAMVIFVTVSSRNCNNYQHNTKAKNSGFKKSCSS